MKKIYLLLLTITAILFFACSNSTNETDKANESSTPAYNILCDNQMIYQGPSEETIGLINETATKSVGADVYYYIWKEDRVEIIEEKDN